ncbi:DUF6299 family protein [Streptomyces sp. NPDC001678]|uniref:DUF6299 family protein n=1 Tax=Streptomyces sp. NPDC001678 TaxID=3364599 RepID=UPI0036880F23
MRIRIHLIHLRTRTRTRVGVAAGALACLATAAPMAQAAPAPRSTGSMTIDPSATLAPDGTLTMSGSYRCTVVEHTGTVFVASNVLQNRRTEGIGGSRAVCDGARHRWRNSARPYGASLRPGPARADGTLLQMSSDRGGIPLPRFLTVARERDITLVPARRS